MPKTKAKKELAVNIVDLHGYLNPKKNKVVATIAYNDGPALVNIRKCWLGKDGEFCTGTGITLTDEEMDALTDILEERKKKKKLKSIDQDGREAVNFGDIFSSASGIAEKRDAGYTTKDGYIRLSKRPGGRR